MCHKRTYLCSYGHVEADWYYKKYRTVECYMRHLPVYLQTSGDRCVQQLQKCGVLQETLTCVLTDNWRQVCIKVTEMWSTIMDACLSS